ncbi:MAG TPA: hypothetical protein QGI71_03630 [Dehalococcoidia bacterium]|nr:hypothetical protein [Dehalococcoidia bacterium]
MPIASALSALPVWPICTTRFLGKLSAASPPNIVRPRPGMALKSEVVPSAA